MPLEMTKLVRTDAGLSSALRVSVMRLARRLRNERESTAPLTLTQFAALGTLFRHGPLRIGELADIERVRPPSMTRTLACLADGGYVARTQDPSDGRQVMVDLTDKGRVLVEADRRARTAWLSQRLRELTPDERRILREAAPILDRLGMS